jgi:plastocyanin
MFQILTAVALVLGLAAGAQGDPARIGQREKRFSMSDIVIARGDSVVFVNDDRVAHNVYSTTKGHEFNLKRQLPGQEVAVPFPNAGTAAVRCAFHPTMRLTITVK